MARPDAPEPAAPGPGRIEPGSARAGSAGGPGQRAARSGQAGRGQRRGGQRQGGDATATRARRGRLRQVEEYSAGGLVLDLNGEVPRGALIGRTDRQGRLLWSLPKGHIEAGETAEQAAVREVEEETGIAGTIVGELGTIDFWFVADGRRIHKTVRHYLMRRVAGELSDADIEVDEVAWVPFSEIRGQLAYPDERGLVDTAGRMLADSA